MLAIVLAGLPGSGKTTLARQLAQRYDCLHVRADAIEAPFVASRGLSGPEGYAAMIQVARDNWALGHGVVLDCVNPLHVTRRMFGDAARQSGARLIQVEVFVSDPVLHRQRVEERRADIPGLALPTWPQVLARQYEAWEEMLDGDVLRVDSAASNSAQALFEQIDNLLTQQGNKGAQTAWPVEALDRARDGAQVAAFLQRQWFSVQMVIRGQVVDLRQAEGFLCRQQEEIIGLITYFINGQDCEITSLDSLIPRRGLGKALVMRVLAQAQALGCQVVRVVTTNDNTRALRLYQQCGFDLAQLRRNALDASRLLKPAIPLAGEGGIALRHEIELECNLAHT